MSTRPAIFKHLLGPLHLPTHPPPRLPPPAAQVFLPLVARLVNDPSSKCRTMVGATLRTLLGRLPPPRLDRLVLYCATWLAGADVRLKRAAAQVG